MHDTIPHYTAAQMLAMTAYETQRLKAVEHDGFLMCPWLELREDDRDAAVDTAAVWIEVMGRFEAFTQELDQQGLTAAAAYGREYISTLTEQVLAGESLT